MQQAWNRRYQWVCSKNIEKDGKAKRPRHAADNRSVILKSQLGFVPLFRDITRRVLIGGCAINRANKVI